jgi:hypothetical protein
LFPNWHCTTRDGSAHTFDFKHYLEQIPTDPRVAADLDRTWLSGAYLVIGDALERNGYFDRAPELELIRHVRNGIARRGRSAPWLDCSCLMAAAVNRADVMTASDRFALLTVKASSRLHNSHLCICR